MTCTRTLSVLTSLLFSASLLAQSGTPNGMPLTAVGSSTMTANGTVTSSSFVTFTTTTLALPLVPPGTTRIGSCDLIWETSATADTPTFALNTGSALTGLWIIGSKYDSSTSASVNFLPIAVVTSATSTAVSAALTAANATTFYHFHTDFTIQTNGTNTELITVFAKINGGTLTVQAGSSCVWHS